MSESVQIAGLSNLVRTLRRAEIDLADLKQANAAAARTVAQWAGVRAPRRTGRLGASVRPARAAGRARVLGGGAGVPYAGVIHYGWPAHHIRANPFIQRAAQETQRAWLADYERDLRRVCAQVRGI